MLSEKAWRFDAVLGLIGGLFMSVAGGMICVLILGPLLKDAPKDTQGFVAFLVSAISLHGAGWALLHIFLRRHGVSWRQFLGADVPGLPRAFVTALILGILAVPFALTLNQLCSSLISWLGHDPVEQPMVTVLQLQSGWARRICTGFAAIVMAPVVEESLFRGILYPIIKERGFPRLAVLGSSAIFALIHFNVMTFVPLMALAIILVQLYERTNTLLAPIFTHAFFNAVNYLLLLNQKDVEHWLRTLRERI